MLCEINQKIAEDRGRESSEITKYNEICNACVQDSTRPECSGNTGSHTCAQHATDEASCKADSNCEAGYDDKSVFIGCFGKFCCLFGCSWFVFCATTVTSKLLYTHL